MSVINELKERFYLYPLVKNLYKLLYLVYFEVSALKGRNMLG
jgi:hypothetical protein